LHCQNIWLLETTLSSINLVSFCVRSVMDELHHFSLYSFQSDSTIFFRVQPASNHLYWSLWWIQNPTSKFCLYSPTHHKNNLTWWHTDYSSQVKTWYTKARLCCCTGCVAATLLWEAPWKSWRIILRGGPLVLIPCLRKSRRSTVTDAWSMGPLQHIV
jgi:hypothetical protein